MKHIYIFRYATLDEFAEYIAHGTPCPWHFGDVAAESKLEAMSKVRATMGREYQPLPHTFRTMKELYKNEYYNELVEYLKADVAGLVKGL